MSGITIGHIPCPHQQEIAQKCDKNRDGKLTGNEITIFEQRKNDFGETRSISKNESTWEIREGDSTTKIKKNEDGTTTSTWQWDGGSSHCAFDKNGVKRSETVHDGTSTSFSSWDKDGNPIYSTVVHATDEEITEDGTNFDVEG